MGTVSKAHELLDLFRRDRPQIGLSDLARLSGLNKATCFRLMSEMQDYGLVEQVQPSREYRIGPAVLRLAALREETVPFRSIVQPSLDTLAEITGELAHVAMLVGERLELVHFAYSNRHATRVMMDDADHLPFHATSSGMVILAFSPPALVERILSQPLKSFTDDTVTDPDLLRTRLTDIRTTGLVESQGGFEREVCSVAAPLFGSNGDCLGAVAVAAAANRVTDTLRRTIHSAVSEAASKITRNWGGTPPAQFPTT